MTKSEEKKKKKEIAEKLHVQVEAMALAYQRLISLHDSKTPLRYTFAVTLSAEPVPEAIQEVKLAKEVTKK